MSTKKKLTPLQEAIREIDQLALHKAQTKEGLQMLSLIRSHIRDTLLPKEKEFAREMWGKGKSYGYNQHFPEATPSPDFEETFKQYES